jgi:hypothetical protein
VNGTLVVHEGTAPQDWDRTLESAGGTVFHARAWADYAAAERSNITPLFVALQEPGGRPLALGLAFLARSPKRLIAPFSGEAWLDSRPVSANGGSAGIRAFLVELQRWLKRKGALELSIGSFATPGNDPPLEELGFSLTHRLEFELNVRQTDEALSAGMEYKRRKNLNKARRLGVQIIDLDADNGVRELRRMQAASGERIVRRGGPDIGRHGDPQRDPVQQLIRHGVGRITGAVVEGELVSVSLFTRFGPLVYHTLSGHGSRALETQAPTLVIWEAVRRYRDEGAERFNFGGCAADAVREDSPEHGVYVYKKAFGAACLECTSGTRILRPLAHRALARVRALIS